ncbi:SepM family pheromone-processing serine protease [Pullulanibacillus sp. KACC 23026]|uniref:SepM family pheromone-processing serine protease n=1 Tax=Pullulanibacillus sp. KACC 23026 TaxID=3028315 RepID=UPI0023B17B89|nr:SepM family pheromone-processing serine protease [Pullulanibacillus sp. KACC 23026]WEG11681.1 SepM family pheromone-processing serine protease [Pullulanibacillus sp. KACC 23026]
MTKQRAKWPYVLLIILIILVVILEFVQVPYYVHKPGTADKLESMVHVKGGYQDQGTMRLVTIYEIKANLLQYLIAKYDFNKYTDVYKVSQIQLPDETQQELNVRNLNDMKTAQDSATYVAYKAAGRNPTIKQLGIKVLDINSEMPAKKVLEPSDLIIEANGKPIHTINDFKKEIKGAKAGQKVQLKIKRGNETKTVSTQLAKFPKDWQTSGQSDEVGLGIVESDDVKVSVTPPVTFNTQGIGGPSAGLMMTLEIYNQLTPSDLSKGYNICGTGTMDFDGTVGPIGGIEEKIVAANKEGVDIFFAPVADHEAKDAEATVKDIHSKIKVVPVKTFDDALNYLKNLKEKKS